jgi:hypothetical protein
MNFSCFLDVHERPCNHFAWRINGRNPLKQKQSSSAPVDFAQLSSQRAVFLFEVCVTRRFSRLGWSTLPASSCFIKFIHWW